MQTVPTMPASMMMAGTSGVTERESKSADEKMIASHIAQVATTLARRGMTASGSRYRRNGPKKRIRTKRSVSQGQERVKHQTAMMRKTVVGRPGTIAPMPASPTQPMPVPASKTRTGESDFD